jgi:hypothetical protein
VADEAFDAVAAFLRSGGAVDPWLADQLLLPLALAERPSRLRTSEVTAHLLTNAEVIRRFLPVEIGVDGPLGVGVRRATFLIDQDGLIRDAVLADIRVGRHEEFIKKAVAAGRGA